MGGFVAQGENRLANSKGFASSRLGRSTAVMSRGRGTHEPKRPIPCCKEPRAKAWAITISMLAELFL